MFRIRSLKHFYSLNIKHFLMIWLDIYYLTLGPMSHHINVLTDSMPWRRLTEKQDRYINKQMKIQSDNHPQNKICGSIPNKCLRIVRKKIKETIVIFFLLPMKKPWELMFVLGIHPLSQDTYINRVHIQ